MPKLPAITPATHWALGADEDGLGVASLCDCGDAEDHEVDLTSWACGCPRDGEPDRD